MTAKDKVLVHPWQDRGSLGRAPYRLVGFFAIPYPPESGNVAGYNYALAECQRIQENFGVGGGTCDVCGTAIMNNYVIRSHDGRYFVVGCDCVRKTGDSQLLTACEAKDREMKRAARRAKARLEAEARIAVFEAELAEQRIRNGGFTDLEVERQQRIAEQRQHEVEACEANQWLLEVLQRIVPKSDFITSMIHKLEREPYDDGHFTRGQVSALGRVWSFGERGKKRQAMIDEVYWRLRTTGPKGQHHSWD